MRLGEACIRQGLINQRQLEEALRAQLVHGGHLGTCLMELGHIDEFRLGRVLAEIFDVPFASADLLRRVRPSVIKSTPAKLVERHHAVPLELQGKILRVAMINPKDLPALDEIAFATGRRTEPWVAPEARILQAMEKYYDVPRRPRYITLCRRLDGEWINRGGPAAGGRSREDRRLARRGSSAMHGPSRAKAERRSLHSIQAVRTAAAVLEPKERYEAELFAPPFNWETISDPVPHDVEDEISELLCHAETVENVAGAVLDYTSRRMARCILFAVQATTAEIWDHRGLWIDRERAAALSFSITSEPVFELFLGDGFYRGPLPPDPRYRGFYDRLQIPVPSEVLILPVHLDDRLVALFYGDGRRSTDIQGGVEQYRLLLRKLAMALNLVLLKRKIRLL